MRWLGKDISYVGQSGLILGAAHHFGFIEKLDRKEIFALFILIMCFMYLRELVTFNRQIQDEIDHKELMG